MARSAGGGVPTPQDRRAEDRDPARKGGRIGMEHGATG